MYKTISPFFYYSDLKRYEHTKSFIGHQYFAIQNNRLYRVKPIVLKNKTMGLEIY